MSEQTPQTLETRIITRALQDPSFKEQLLSGPVAAKAAIEKEIEQKLPQDLQVNVLEETDKASYVVLPKMPSVDEVSEEELESVAGGRRRPSSGAIGAATAVTSLFTNTLPCTFGSITFK
ncbi:NHLP leader peptide family RiPP precursor [Mastigocoleus testarum]|uniref:NHLP leader peptide family natural product n=1 Tax=Mastigocoleus testarum BC008 TaxID=371196 RepID=A0A0V7ZXP7_9CYAN|nr:NHLP leader peptide family RiPP precursor [Mastigocoleus testarum]KST69182.1 hypothetical protein BC008_03070 [Mastigocoleus testarum BC008]KST69202.1 hypothetical protein BC008_03170 [Mastigocoleus testarum BC008]